MKKLFFTAVAVLAFSSVGFAEGKVAKGKVKFYRASCMTQMIQLINSYDHDPCFTSSQYSYFATTAAILCAGN